MIYSTRITTPGRAQSVKKVIEIMTRGLSGAEAYYMGNIIKYLYRYPKKGTLLSDLAKAEEYTKFLRELFMEDGGKA